MENNGRDPIIIAHRGACQGAPENTLAALELAALLGAQWIEFDVQLTADGRLVVIHDFTLERVSAHRGLVLRHKESELVEMDVGSWFSPSFSGQTIPTFAQFIDGIIRLGLSPIIEIKTEPPHGERVAEMVCAYVAKHWPADRPPPMISSFDRGALKVLHSSPVKKEIGFSAKRYQHAHIEQMREIGCSCYHVNYKRITAREIAALKSSGIAVYVYTVDDVADFRRMRDYGVDGFFTNAYSLLNENL